MVEADVNIRSPNRQDWLVGVFLPTLRQRNRPVPPEVERPGNNDVSLVILQPRRVHRLPVHGIDDNLRIKLPSRKRKQSARRLPGEPIVTAYRQRDARCCAGGTVGYRPVLRIKNVNVPVTVSGDRRLPLITGLESETFLRHESRNAQGGFSRGQNQQNQQRGFQHSSRPGLEVSGRKKHATEPLTPSKNPFRTLP